MRGATTGGRCLGAGIGGRCPWSRHRRALSLEPTLGGALEARLLGGALEARSLGGALEARVQGLGEQQPVGLRWPPRPAGLGESRAALGGGQRRCWEELGDLNTWLGMWRVLARGELEKPGGSRVGSDDDRSE